jgi:cold shock protein
MQNQLQLAVCQKCGRGFVLTDTYRRFLTRRGRRVIKPMLCPTCFRKIGPLPKQRGEVKWFSQRRHYGFIITGEGEEIFFHQQQLFGDMEAHPQNGQTAWFHLHYSPKGPEALNVEIVEE